MKDRVIVMKKNWCDKNCSGMNRCDRNTLTGNCHLRTPLGELAAFRNPHRMLQSLWEAGFRYDQETKSFVVR